jgi:hypothetical protein
VPLQQSCDPKGAAVDDKPSSIPKWGRLWPRDKRTNRPKNIGKLLVAIDLEDRRILTTFGWIDFQMVDIPMGIRLKAGPRLLFVPLSYN